MFITVRFGGKDFICSTANRIVTLLTFTCLSVLVQVHGIKIRLSYHHFLSLKLDCQEALFNPNCITKVLLEDIKKRCRRDREGLTRFCLCIDPVSRPFYLKLFAWFSMSFSLCLRDY